MAAPRHEYRNERFDRFVAAVHMPLLVLSLTLIPILVIPEVFTTSAGERDLLDVCDYLIWAVFVVDYGARLYLATHRRSFVRHNLLDLALVLLPIARPLRVARAARVLRLGRLAILLGRETQHARASLQARAVAWVGVTTAVLTFGCSVAMLDVERHAPTGNIKDYSDALWWAFTTVSTVGYGDRYPTTEAGRLVAVVLIAAGVSLFGVITAAVAAWFVRQVKDGAAEDAELQTRLANLEATLARIEAALAPHEIDLAVSVT